MLYHIGRGGWIADYPLPSTLVGARLVVFANAELGPWKVFGMD